MGWLKRMIQNYLQINPAQATTIDIDPDYDWEGNAIRNRIWYRGEAGELRQFYHQCNEAGTGGFWASVPSYTRGIAIQKIHSGIPGIMVSTLANLVLHDLNLIQPDNDKDANDWERIADDNSFKKTLYSAVSGALAIGDGAFKISIDTSISQYPIIEWVDGDRVTFTARRGRIIEVTFKTVYKHDDREYHLYEHYGRGYINYTLTDASETRKLPLSEIPETAGLEPIEYTGNFMLAIPFKIRDSSKFPGRGDSIFTGKYGAFDGLDEIISQWAAEVRHSRPMTYIPTALCPRDKDGRLKPPDTFTGNFVVTQDDMREGAQQEIKVIQPELDSDAMKTAYSDFLNMSLQGVISPATLGIDLKTNDNATAQREKEKNTLYTRGQIVEALTNTIPLVVQSALKAFDLINGTSPRTGSHISIDFGEYDAPSFDSAVETVAKARQAGIMSTEMAISQLYGDSLTDEEKDAELEHIQNENSVKFGDSLYEE